MRRESDNSNWGGARKGAGRPKEVTKSIDSSEKVLLLLPLPLPMWTEFSELATSDLVQSEEDLRRLALIIMADGMHRYIKSKKRATRKESEKQANV